MKAAAIFADNQTLKVLTDIPEPKLTAPDDVKLRILQVGVCATDREIASFIVGIPPAGSDYLVLGHEAIRRSCGAHGAASLPGSGLPCMPQRPFRFLHDRAL